MNQKYHCYKAQKTEKNYQVGLFVSGVQGQVGVEVADLDDCERDLLKCYLSLFLSLTGKCYNTVKS
jgi:hypothetical protein